MKTALLFIAVLNIQVAEAQWAQTNGPYGGTVSCWAVKGGTVFGGTYDGIIVSADSGAHWTPKNEGMRSVWVLCLAVGENSLFAGTYGHGISRSSDNGESWLQIGNALTQSDHMVNSMCVIPPQNGIGNPRVIIGNGWGGIFRSDDLGDSWLPGDSVTRGRFAYSFAISGNTVIASTDVGLLRSTDRGVHWAQVHPNQLFEPKCFVVRGTDIFAGGSRGVSRSADNGTTWVLVDSVTFSTMDISSIAFVDSDLFVGTTSSFIFGPGRGVFRSADNGDHWAAVNTGISSPVFPPEISAEALAVVGRRLLAGTDHGIFLTTNKGTWWTSSNSGFRNSRVSIVTRIGNALLAGTWRQGVFRSMDEGTSWTSVNYGMGEVDVNAFAIAGSIERPVLFAGTNRGLFKSSDSGTTWTATYNDISNQSILSLLVNGAYVMAGGSGGVISSTDGGASWRSASSGLPSPANVVALVVAGTNLFAGTNQLGIFRSTDQGSTWVSSNNGLPNSGGYNTVSSLAAVNTRLFAAAGRLYVSADSGANWRVVEAVPTGAYITSVVVMGSRLFVTESPGKVYMSPDEGSSWTGVENGLPIGALINSLSSDSNYFFAATEDEGVWRRPMSELAMTSVDRTLEKTIPSQTSLLQNYPNPFNPQTGIRYQVPGVSDVRIAVYDLLGREVAVLVNEPKAPGSYEVRFDGSGLASGVYLYRLQAGTVTQTRKLLLLH